MKPDGQQAACPFCGAIVIHMAERAEVLHAMPVCDDFAREMKAAGLVAAQAVAGFRSPTEDKPS